MHWLGELRRRIQFLFRNSQADRDLAEEMRLHVELREAERAGRGTPAQEAKAEARRLFGNFTRLREDGRDAWGWGWLESLGQDLRYGIRTLLANPGFAITAVLSLALGIGANTAIFTIVNAEMLRSLPVEDPRQLVKLTTGPNGSAFTNPIWEQVRDHQQAFSGVLAFGTARFDLTDGGESRFASGLWVSGEFFRVLGVAPLRGRMFTKADDVHGGGSSGPVAVISYGFWQRNFGGDEAVIGKTVRLDRHSFEIIGVAPPWFRGLDVDQSFDVAIPIGCEPILHTDESALNHRAWWWLRILGRLTPGTTSEQASAQMMALSPEINRSTLPADYSPEGKARYLKRSVTALPAAVGFSQSGTRYRTALFTLMAIVGLVLLIACANIANLLLARAAARRREISTRLAIGAGRSRVIRQLLTESLLLSALGAGFGLVFARWGSTVLVRLLSTTNQILELDLTPDLRVLAFTAGVALLTGILFGVAPAFRATGMSPNSALKENARGTIAGSSRFRLGKALVVAQVALSLVLLAGAGLFLGTMRNLIAAPLGFDPHNVLLVHADTLAKIPRAQRNEFFQTILDRVRTLPGVIQASSSLITPVSNRTWDDDLYPEGYQPKSSSDTLAFFNRVSPQYFQAMGSRLLMGRDFATSDTLGAPNVMIINESAAKRFFSGRNPIGKTIAVDRHGAPGMKDTYQVIGVSLDAKYQQIRERAVLMAFLPMAQDPEPGADMILEIRHNGQATAIAAATRPAIAKINPGISLEFRNLETQIDDSLIQERAVALLSAFFGALAVLLATVGLYGVTSYTVLRRQAELGVRIALGAPRNSVVWLVLRDVTVTLALGLALGIAVAFAASKLVVSLLFGVQPTDLTTLMLAALILGSATLIAGYLPARRASRLDPMAALRDE